MASVARQALSRVPRMSTRALHSTVPSPTVLLPRSTPATSSITSKNVAKEAARLSAVCSSSQMRMASTESKTQEMTCRDALNSAMEEEMLRDDKVFILGEEVARCECSVHPMSFCIDILSR